MVASTADMVASTAASIATKPLDLRVVAQFEIYDPRDVGEEKPAQVKYK
jgi:hypothetical protein